MLPLISQTQTLAYDLTPTNFRLPPFVWSTFTLLNKIHGVWRCYRWIDVRRRPDNFVQLLAGHAVSWLVGDKLIVRVATQCLLVSTRLLECVQQQNAVMRSGKQWLCAVQGRYPKPVRVFLRGSADSTFVPSVIDNIKIFMMKLYFRIERIVRYTFDLLFQLFKLSMHLLDVMDSFRWSSEAKQEVFVNIAKWLNAIADNRDELLQGIIDHREIIEKLLVGSVFTYEQLYEGVKKTVEKTVIVQAGVKKISTIGGGVIVELAKRVVGSVMVVIGLAKYRPLALAPRADFLQD